MHQVAFVLEGDVCLLNNATPLDVNQFMGIHQDVADARIMQQRLEWTKAENLVEDVVCQPVAVGCAERHTLLGEQLKNDGQKSLPPADVIGLNSCKLFQIHPPDQLMVQHRLQ